MHSQKAAYNYISNVSCYHVARFNIHRGLGSQDRIANVYNGHCFPRPITPPHGLELNFPPVMTAICADLNSGMCVIDA